MKVKYVRVSSPVIVHGTGKPIKTGDIIQVSDKIGENLIKGGSFEKVESRSSKKSRKEEKNNWE